MREQLERFRYVPEPCADVVARLGGRQQHARALKTPVEVRLALGWCVGRRRRGGGVAADCGSAVGQGLLERRLRALPRAGTIEDVGGWIMLTLSKVKAEIATYHRPVLREAGGRVVVKLEALCGSADASEVSRAHLEEVAAGSTDMQELLVVSELGRLGDFELWPSPAPLSVTETPVFERTRRISDMIASTLAKPTQQR